MWLKIEFSAIAISSHGDYWTIHANCSNHVTAIVAHQLKSQAFSQWTDIITWDYEHQIAPNLLWVPSSRDFASLWTGCIHILMGSRCNGDFLKSIKCRKIRSSGIFSRNLSLLKLLFTYSNAGKLSLLESFLEICQ